MSSQADTLAPGEDIDVFFDINSEELIAGLYDLNVEILNNAHPDSLIIPLTVEVISNDNFVENKDDLFSNKSFELFVNYPNPFNSNTTISYSIRKESMVKLRVFDISGREVGVLVNELKQSGLHRVPFNVDHLPAGVYFSRLDLDGFTAAKEMILVK